MKITAVLVLVAANVLVFGLQYLWPEQLENLFALWPLQPTDGQGHFEIWQILSYAFLHGGTAHIVFNMIGLWTFGSQIERYVGPTRLLICYFASVFTAALTQLFIPMLFGAEAVPVIGASGGVFGLLLAYAVLFPRNKVIALMLPIPMPAWLFAIIFAAIELFLGVTGTLPSIAHFAHLGGMVGSALVLLQWRASILKKR
jgi:membrane associated rhomboid family serine protease